MVCMSISDSCLIEDISMVATLNQVLSYLWRTSLKEHDYDFILCAGDDVSDENMFSVLSKDAFTIKVGGQTTKASFFVENNIEMIDILKNLNWN